MNMWIEVAADNGSKASFYIRENSSITDANGKYISMHDLPAPLANKKIEIRYSVITDAKNGLEKFETGKNGVLIIHFLDWKAKS